MDTAHELVFLGTGAACGNPTFFCGCEACQEALENPVEAKTCSSIAVMGTGITLIDTAPELRLQFAREGISAIDRVLFTHQHFDHTGGLPQLEFAVRLVRHDPLPVYATAECLAWLATHYDWMWDVVEPHVVEPFQTLTFDGVSYTALPASHCEGAVGYEISCDGARLAYFPDTGPLKPAVLQRLQGLDALIHDSTFIGRNWNPASHTTVDGTIALGRTLGAKAVYLTHCSLHYDEPHTATALRAELAARDTGGMRVVLPHDGLRLNVGDLAILPATPASDALSY